jgi:hypothetical protein
MVSCGIGKYLYHEEAKMAHKGRKMLACGCCWDVTYDFHQNAKGSQYRFGDDDDVRYKKPSRRGKKCKKSKDGKHEFITVYTTYGYRSAWSESDKRFKWSYGEVTKYKCFHCGKPSPKRFP